MADQKVLVIGGGAAGLLAAGRAAELGANVVLLEKNKMVGRKLLITGKGRCNVTNAGDINKFIENFSGNGRFLFSAFSKFFNQELEDLLKAQGVALKVERGGRIFPVSDKAADIVKALQNYAVKNGALIPVSYTHLSLGFIKHQYPHCWRCKKPIMYRATEQWFASIGGNRQ